MLRVEDVIMQQVHQLAQTKMVLAIHRLVNVKNLVRLLLCMVVLLEVNAPRVACNK